MRVRQHWELGEQPIANMVSLLERNGIIVGEFATDSREIDAFYQYSEENNQPSYCVILGTDKHSFYRRQFNCAHELGHIILHERYDDLNEIDRDEYRRREDEANKPVHSAKEKMECLYYGYDYAGTLIGVSLSKPVFIFNASDEYEWLSAERAT